MATYVPAKVSTQYVFYASLVSQANTKLMQVNPTIASGDFKVSIDGAALANLGTLPAVTPAGSTMVKFTLSTSEMAGANATVVCIDAAGSEWCDLVINIPTAARQIDDLATPTNITAASGIDISKILGTAISTPATAGILDVNVKNMNNVAGTPITTIKAVQGLTTADTIATVGTGGIAAASFAAGAIDAAAIAANAIGASEIADGAIDAAAFAAGAINAAAIATDAIDADALAADAVTEIWAKACTEPTAVIAASPTAIAALSWLATLSRNKITQTATTQILKADDTSTTIATSTLSDDSVTFTRGEFA